MSISFFSVLDLIFSCSLLWVVWLQENAEFRATKVIVISLVNHHLKRNRMVIPSKKMR